MGWSRVQSASNTASSAASVACTLTGSVAAGDLISVQVANTFTGSPITSPTVTDSGGNTYTQDATQLGSSGASKATVQLWSTVNGSTHASLTITFTPPLSGNLAISATEYNGPGTLATDGSSGGAGSSGTSLSSGSWTTAHSSDLQIGVGVAITTGQTWTNGGGSWNTLFSQPGSVSCLIEDLIGATVGSVSSVMSDSVSGAWACVGVAYSASGIGDTLSAAEGSFVETGENAALTHQRAILATPGAIAETGEPASLRWGHVDVVSAGPFSLTGDTITLVIGGILVASAGSFAETGKSASLLHTHVEHANPGAFIETGEAATLVAGASVNASTGVFQLIPTTAGLTVQHELFAGLGTFSLTGKGALLYPGVTLFANPGAFSVGRIPANLLDTHDLFAAPGSFSLAGQPVVLNAGLTLNASTGVFAVTGESAGLADAHLLVTGEATFELTGESASLTVNEPSGPPGPTAYHLYSNTGVGDPINYETPIATAYGLTWTSQPLEGPAEWSFGVRAFSPITGLEEQNLDCSVTVDLDAEGDDVTDTPAPPIGILALARANGAITVEWQYPAIHAASAPTGFNIYIGTGGVPNYATPAATVSAGTGLIGQYQAFLTGQENGVPYTIGVRAFNAIAQELNTYTVTVTAVSIGPRAVVGLTATAIAQS